MLRAGFIGLGAMGAPMAKRIVSAGFDLSVFDVRPENADPLVDLGATRAGSPREAAEGAEALVLMVVNAEQAENALFGEDGAAETLSPKSAVVLMSTIGPGAVRGIEGRLAWRGPSVETCSSWPAVLLTCSRRSGHCSRRWGRRLRTAADPWGTGSP